MKRLFTFIICVLALQIVKAHSGIVPIRQFTYSSGINTPDTNLLAPVVQPPVSIYQNVIYKRRLDSIQKDVPLDYNEYVQAYIDTYMRRRDEIGRMIGLSRYYFPIYEKAFSDAGIPEEIKYLSIVESALNPNATSRVGASGLWQFMSETAKIYGLNMTDYVDERRDPVQSSYAAAAYLKDAYQQFGDWLLAIASYNCGKSNVEHALERTGTHDFWSIRELLPPETRGYVPAFIAVNYIMKYHNRHNIVPQTNDMAIATDTLTVNKFVSLSRVSAALGMNFRDLCVLNPSYKQQVVNGTTALPRRIIIPQVNKETYAYLREAVDNPNAPLRAVKPIQYIAAAEPAIPIQQSVIGGVAYHTTRQGETLAQIASRYGIKINDLLQWNKELGNNTNARLVGGLTVKVSRG
jgi:membrane-bound lytic murein transglycosylase D